MQIAKVLCKCGKQVAYYSDFSINDYIQQREFDLLKEQGYDVIVGEDLRPNEFALEPCYDDGECAFLKAFKTTPGFHNIYEWANKVC
jgi:hypothetical protein